MKFSSTGRILGSQIEDVGFQLVQADRQACSNSHPIVCKDIKGKEYFLGTSCLKKNYEKYVTILTSYCNCGTVCRKICVSAGQSLCWKIITICTRMFVIHA
jgi:hypothetical protein